MAERGGKSWRDSGRADCGRVVVYYRHLSDVHRQVVDPEGDTTPFDFDESPPSGSIVPLLHAHRLQS